MMIDGAYPATGGSFFLSVLLPFKALHLQDDLELAPIFAAPANEIVRAILVSRALPFVGDGEVEMVVAGIGDHFRHPLQLIRHAVLPLWRVEHDVADMAFGCAHTGAYSAEEHLRRGPNRAKALDDGQNGLSTNIEAPIRPQDCEEQTIGENSRITVRSSAPPPADREHLSAAAGGWFRQWQRRCECSARGRPGGDLCGLSGIFPAPGSRRSGTPTSPE
jgi:hypothetical protein